MGDLLPDTQVCEAYRRIRQSVLDLLAETDESYASLPVPACPEWTVQQTASHLVGVPEDLLAGRVEGITSDAWTNAQVQRHAGETLNQLRDALEATIVPFDERLPRIPQPSNSQLVMDALTHEIDVREALGLPYVDSSLPLSVARAWLLNMIEGRAPSLSARLSAVECTDFDLVRALTGRRSVSQMNDLGLPGQGLSDALAGTPLRPPIHLPVRGSSSTGRFNGRSGNA